MKKLISATQPRHSRIGIAIAAALGLFSGTTWAQVVPAAQPATQATEDAPSDKRAAKVTKLQTVLVTANKRVENVRKVAASISVIGQEAIENQHVTQLSDLQASVPGLFVNSGGSPGQTTVSLRGVSPLSSSATVGAYLDETPLGSSGVYQGANVLALDLLPYDIGRIEVLRGPQGTLYGASTMGGLIKYVTIAPDLASTEFRVGGGISSVQNSGDLGWNARFGANVPLVTDRVGLRVSYARNDLPGYIDNSVTGEKDINGGRQTSARAALLWQGETASLSLTALRQTIDSDNNGLVALHPTTLKPLYGDLVNSVYVDEKFSKDVDYYAATVNWDLGWADFVSATGYSDTSTARRLDASESYGVIATLLGQPSGSAYVDYGFNLTKFTQEFRLVSKAAGPFEWMVGAFYTKEDAKQTQALLLNKLDGSPLPAPFNAFNPLQAFDIPSDYKEKAIFANGAYQFNDVFKLGAGVRYAENDQTFTQTKSGSLVAPYSKFNTSSEGVFTWSLSPQLQLSERSMLYGRVAKGYQPGGPNVIVPGLPSVLDSSTLINYELGFRSESADQRVLFDVTGFYIDWSHIQVATVVGGISGLVNGGKASSRGVELSTAFRVTPQFRLGLNAAYTDAQLDDDFPVISAPPQQLTYGVAGDRLPYVADWSWAATGDYDIVLDGGWLAHFGGAVRWVGDRTNGTTHVVKTTTIAPPLVTTTVTPPIGLDSYWALDLNVSLSNEHWTLRAYAKNVTDERGYQTIDGIPHLLTGAYPKLTGAPIQPRTFGIEFDYSF